MKIRSLDRVSTMITFGLAHLVPHVKRAYTIPRTFWLVAEMLGPSLERKKWRTYHFVFQLFFRIDP